MYDSTESPLPGNLPSVGGEAYSFSELGNQVTLAGTARVLDTVNVTLSSWGCQSGTWFGNNCSTASGATFSMPITLNIYNVGPGNTVGSQITSVTQTFAIPYRPSADAVNCPSTGKWYDATSATCFNGLATNITFNFGHVALPNSVIYGIAYNTTHYGYAPIGESAACFTSSGGCPYDSLNIALSTNPGSPAVGTDPIPGTIYQNASFSSDYCDGTPTPGTFQLDSPTSACWTGFVPAVQFNAVATAAPIFTSPSSVTVQRKIPFSFTVSATGVPVPSFVEIGTLPAGVTFVDNHNGTATLSGKPKGTDALGAYAIKFKAVNSVGKAIQPFTINVTS